MKPYATIISFLLIALTCFFNACNESENEDRSVIKVTRPDVSINPKDSMVYWNYGALPDYYWSYAESKISEKYGIEFRDLGCEVNDSLILFILTNNKALFDRLQYKFPKLDEQQMRFEIQDCVALHQKLEQIALSTSMVKRLQNETKNDDDFYTKWHPDTTNKSEYILEYYQSDVKPKIDALMFTFKINPTNLDIMLKGSDGQWSECTK